MTHRIETAASGEGFTPGPWLATDGGDGHVVWLGGAEQHPHNYESHHRWECSHFIGRDEECEIAQAQYQQSEANARLIAAAPDLHKATKEALGILEQYCDFLSQMPVSEIELHPYIPSVEIARDMARDALAKAQVPA